MLNSGASNLGSRGGLGPQGPPRSAPGKQTPLLGADTPPTVHAGRYEQRAGGTHPPGMHTCFYTLLEIEKCHISHLSFVYKK